MVDLRFTWLVKVTFPMKSTKVQTLGAVALHATTACTDDLSIVGLSPPEAHEGQRPEGVSNLHMPCTTML